MLLEEKTNIILSTNIENASDNTQIQGWGEGRGSRKKQPLKKLAKGTMIKDILNYN